MIRTQTETYVEYSTGEREYYDLTQDPYQMENGAGDPQNTARISELQDKLERLKACSGPSCRATEGGAIDVEITAPSNGSYDTDSTITLSGKAGANSAVEVFEGATLKAPTTAGAEENWSATLEDVAEGGHTYVAKSTDGAGKTLSSEPAIVTVDTVKPKASDTVPRAGGAGVRPRSNVTAVFSEAMKGTTVRRAIFELRRKGAEIRAAVSYNAASKTATLNPTENLVPGGTYVATVSTDARDRAGNALDQRPAVAGNQSAVWSFTVRR